MIVKVFVAVGVGLLKQLSFLADAAALSVHHLT